MDAFNHPVHFNEWQFKMNASSDIWVNWHWQRAVWGSPKTKSQRVLALFTFCHNNKRRKSSLKNASTNCTAASVNVWKTDTDLNCTKWPEKLPKNVFLRFRGQVVNEDAPAAAVQGCLGRIGGAGWQQWVGSKEIASQRWIPAEKNGNKASVTSSKLK